jgi:hypothetical protein
MKFYKVQMLGRFIAEMVSVSALSYNASLDEGRIVYNEDTNTLYFGDNTQFGPVGQGGIPATEIILFEKNTAVSGYTLLTSVDDETVFISKGAGSVIGPGATSVGTWTQSGHTHTGPSHTHTATTDAGTYTNDDPRPGVDGTPVQRVHTHALTTTSDGTGATGSSATANTWRPAGRIFTRQQKI